MGARIIERGQREPVANDTYYVRGVAVLNLQEVHRPNHGLHRHENVLIHEFDEPSLILVRVTGTVDDPHLLNEGGLTRLAGACNKISIPISSLSGHVNEL